MKFVWAILFFLVLSFGSFAQSARKSGFLISGDVFGTRIFVENKGQFNNEVDSREKIIYAYQDGTEQIFFTSQGLIYKFSKAEKLSEEEIEKRAEGEKTNKPKKSSIVHMNWEYSNTAMSLEVSEKQERYFSNGPAELNAACYKKLTYKNVYNGIDIEYTIPADKKSGIKYTVILHPMANPGQIRILYSGDVKKIKLEGNTVIVRTRFEDITEHSPTSFSKNGSLVTTSFTLKNGRIGFNFPEGYDSKEEIQIDPWVSTLNALTTNNMGYDVDFDNAGNLYVYGGGSSNGVAGCKIAKYSQAGALVWTFLMSLPPVNWNTAGLNGIPSNFTVNKTTQKVYTAETFGGKIVRLNVNGNYDNFITPPGFGWDEIWELGFNPCTGVVYAFGGGTSQNKHAAIINETNSTAVPVNLSGFAQTNQDILCQTIDESGDIFVAFVVPSTNTAVTTNYLLKANAGFNGNSWVQLTTYNSFIEYSNKPFFSGLPPAILAPSSNGFNCLSVNNNFLFYYDGLNVAAYNKVSGVQVGNITIPGYTPLYQGGIAVDACNNVYVGGNGVIHVFQFTGTTFLSLPVIQLGLNPGQRVYDIRLDRSSNLLYVSGTNFAGTFNASQICTGSDQLAVSFSCSASGKANAVASVTTSAANPKFSFSWTGSSGLVGQKLNSVSNTDTLLHLANGNYTISCQINAPCGPLITTTININCPLCSVTASGNVSCTGSGFGFLVQAVNVQNFFTPPTFSWIGPSGFNATTSGSTFLNGGFGIYTLTASNATCISTSTVLLASPALAILTINASPATGCVGENVYLNGTASGGITPYSFSWKDGPSGATRTINESDPGIYNYTLTMTDAANCKVSSVYNLDIKELPIVTVNSATVCEGTNVLLYAKGADSYVWQPVNSIVNPLAVRAANTSTFTVKGTKNGCSDTATARVTVLPAPLFTVSSFIHEGCAPLCIDLASSLKNNSYVWYLNNAPITVNTSTGYCFVKPGDYFLTLYVSDANGCTGKSSTQVVSVYPKPVADFSFYGDLIMPYPQVYFQDESRGSFLQHQWYFGDGNESSEINPSHIFPEVSTYQAFLVVEDNHGCSDTTSKTIKIAETSAIYIPNTFTPNNDGQNDLFYVKGTGVRDFKICIFNRWGEKIFETSNINTSWDGTYKGIAVKEDSYAWQIIYTLTGQRTKTIAGHINVVR